MTSLCRSIVFVLVAASSALSTPVWAQLGDGTGSGGITDPSIIDGSGIDGSGVDPDAVGGADVDTSQDIPWACPDGEVLENYIDNFCLDCLLPIAILGNPIPSSDNFPSMAASEAFNTCPSYIFWGTDLPCMMTGMWETDKFLEVTRTPWCSMVMGGERLDGTGNITDSEGHPDNQPSDGEGGDAPSEAGSDGADGGDTSLGTYVSDLLGLRLGDQQADTEGGDQTANERVFYHHHSYTNPGSFITGMVTGECNFGGSEIALMWMSEILSEWEDDELALQLAPEAVLLSSLPVALACMADAVVSMFGEPLTPLFWCAGTWVSTTYPFTGAAAQPWTNVVDASATMTKALAFGHRLGLAEQSIGESASCGNHPSPFLVKSQYKFQHFYPRPETSSNHWIGNPPLFWGEWRSVPAIGEDFLITLWRWNDCCIRFP